MISSLVFLRSRPSLLPRSRSSSYGYCGTVESDVITGSSVGSVAENFGYGRLHGDGGAPC